jgi:hypothetical protein
MADGWLSLLQFNSDNIYSERVQGQSLHPAIDGSRQDEPSEFSSVHRGLRRPEFVRCPCFDLNDYGFVLKSGDQISFSAFDFEILLKNLEAFFFEIFFCEFFSLFSPADMLRIRLEKREQFFKKTRGFGNYLPL